MSNNRFTVDQLQVNTQLLNPVIEQLTTHKSVRSFKPNEKLSADVIDILIAAAQSAPTSSNFQSWSMIIVEDEERKQKLMELSGNQAFVGEASALFVFCADASRHKY